MHVQLRELFLHSKNYRFRLLPLYCPTVITPQVLLPSMRCLPGSYTQTGTCRVPAQPYWVWRALVVCSLASTSQTHRKPPLLASTKRTQWNQTSSQFTKPVKLFWKTVTQCLSACVVRIELLPAWVAVPQWMHSLDNSQPRDQPENTPEETVIGWVWVMVKSSGFCKTQAVYTPTTVSILKLQFNPKPCFCLPCTHISLTAHNLLQHKQRPTFMTLKSTSWPKLSFSLKNSCSG